MPFSVPSTLTIASAVLAANGQTMTVTLAGGTGTHTPASPVGFFCYVNGLFNQVTAASMNASGIVTLTLAEPVRASQVVRIKYDFTSPGGTQIVDSSTPTANGLYYIDQYAVTNNSTVTSALTLTSPTVSASGLAMTFSISGSTGTINLGAPIANGYTPYGFKIIVNSTTGGLNPVLGVSVASTTLTLTLQNVINSTDTVQYLYDYRGGAQIWDSAGTINSLGNVTTATSVTNNSTVTANFFTDSFNDTNGTNLTAHTPNVGTSWTATTTSMVIRNGAQSGTSNTHFVSNTSAGVASNTQLIAPAPSYSNYRVTGDIYIRTLLNSAATYYVRGNSTGTTGYSLAFNPNSKLLTVNKLGGSFPSGVVNTFSLSSTTFAAGQTYSMGFEVIDGFIHDSRGGSSVVSYTVTAPGSGYTSNPTVVIDGSKSGGLSASATVTRSANTVASIALNGDGGGSAYYITPGVTFTGGGGTGAAATAVLGQGRPCTILTVYWATGAQQTLTTPVLTIVDPVNPTAGPGNVLISSTNDTSTTGLWHANFHVDYSLHGYTPIQPQYQYFAALTDGTPYPATTFNATVGSLPSLDGMPPYSYTLSRNTSLSTSGATLINSFGASPSSLLYTDTPTYSLNPYFYFYTVTDATGATAQAFQQKAGLLAYPQYVEMWRDAPLNIYFMGDSIRAGGFFSNSVYAVLSSYKAPRTVNNVTEDANVLQFASYIQGQSGSNTSQWVKGQSFYNTAVTNILALKCTVADIALGENDVRDGQTYDSYIPPATYAANLLNTASNLLIDCGPGAGGLLQKVIIQYPYAAVPGSNANGNGWTPDIRSRMSDYKAAIDGVTNGTTILAGASTSKAFFVRNTLDLTDGVHPSTAYATLFQYSGGVWIGFLWGNAIAYNLYGVSTGAATSYSLNISAASTVGQATNVTLVANGTTTATVTLSDNGGGGSFSSTTAVLNGITPVTVTYTPGSAGAKSISSTNNSTLSDPSIQATTATAGGGGGGTASNVYILDSSEIVHVLSNQSTGITL